MSIKILIFIILILQISIVFCSGKIIKPPWHFVDINIIYEKDFYYVNSVSIDIIIENNISENYNIYIAAFGMGYFNDIAFYGGMQTSTGGFRNKYKTDYKKHKKIDIGKGFIFSRWGERRPEAIKMAKGGVAESAGYEGNFISVRNSFKWRKGRYTLSLIKRDTVMIKGKIYSWVDMIIYEHKTQKRRSAGMLAFPGKDLRLSRKLFIFLEVYGSKIPLSKIPHFKVWFGPYKINGVEMNIHSAYAFYSKDKPIFADVYKQYNGIGVEVGKIFSKNGLKRKGNSYYKKIY